MKQPHQKRTQKAIAPSQPQAKIVRPSLHPIEELQNAIGNRGVNQLLASQAIPSQPKSPAKPLFRGLSRELTLQREEDSAILEGAKPISSTLQRSPLLPQQLQQHPATATPSASESGGVIQAKGETTGDRPDSSVEQRPNKTGLPDDLKAGVEKLSGYSLDDVRVHYNSPEPAKLQALAYTRGTEIHVGPGQETHLAHEAWHAVQQKQGRVQPTSKEDKGLPINEEESMEREADVMGEKATQLHQREAFTKRTGMTGERASEHEPAITPRSPSPRNHSLFHQAKPTIQFQRELGTILKSLARYGEITVKYNQSNLMGYTPWVMVGNNPHISIHPDDNYLFVWAGRTVNNDPVSTEELLVKMGFNELHVTINGKHNYFDENGKWKSVSYGGDESDRRTKEEAKSIIGEIYVLGSGYNPLVDHETTEELKARGFSF